MIRDRGILICQREGFLSNILDKIRKEGVFPVLTVARKAMVCLPDQGR